MEKVNICKTNFHGEDVSHDVYYNAMVVLKVDSVYKQGVKATILYVVYVDIC